ncbi:MAG: hypothetical protein ACHQM4_06840 [Thermoanaerobaculia bacterium]
MKHETKVFHVQTEDRGLANPVVESLVYVGGEILMSKKSPYRDLISGDHVDEKALREMMDLQHRRVIEAVRRGRLDKGKIGEAPPDWADDTLPHPDKVSPAALAAVSAMLSAPPEPLPGDRKPARAITSAASPAFVQQPAPPPPAPAPAPPASAAPSASAVSPASASPRISAASSERLAAAASLSRPPAPPPAVRAPAPAGPQKPRSGAALRSLDQVIVDYLASEAASEHLEIALTADGDIVSNETVSLTVKASTSLTEKPLAGAHVSIRVVSTVRPPQILFRGVTGADGIVKSVCVLPDIGTGNAALIIAASSGLGNNEIKQLIRKKPR